MRRLSFEAAQVLRRRAEVITGMRTAQERTRNERQAGHGRPAPARPSDRQRDRQEFPAPTVSPTRPEHPARPEGSVGADPATPAVPAGPPPAGLRLAAKVAVPAGRSRSAPRPPSPARPTAPPRPPAKPSRPRPTPGGGVSLQPILAGAGATLLAVAAIVFVFFTFGDNLALRAIVTGIVTVTAATVAALLRRGGLRTTSEAVAALAAVLCWVDVELAMQAGLLGGLDPALARAVVLAVLAPAFILVGHRLRVRTWASAGLVAALAVPLSAAAGLPGSAWSSWWWVAAWTLVAFVAWAATRVLPAITKRLGTRLGVERRALRIVRAAALPAALAVSFTTTEILPLTRTGATAVLWSAVVAVALAGGYLLRVRSWASVAVLAAPVAPVLATAGVPAAAWTTSAPWPAWWWTLAFVLVALVAFGAMRALPALGNRLGAGSGGPFAVEARILRVVRAAGVPAALLASVAASVGAAGAPLPSGWGATSLLWSVVVAAALLGGLLLRVRSWVTTAVLAAPALPALVAAALPASPWTAWWWTCACVATAFVALAAVRGLPAMARRLGDGLGRPFTAEADLLRVVRAASLPLALLASCFAAGVPPLNGWGTTTLLWSAVVAVAFGGGWALRARSWTSTAVLAAPAVPLLAVAGLPRGEWSAWWWVSAIVLVAFVALGAMRGLPAIARRLGDRLGHPFTPESHLLRVVRAVALPAALAVSLAAAEAPGWTKMGATAALWSAVAAVALLGGALLRVRSWVSAGLLAVPLVPAPAVAGLAVSEWSAWWWTGASVLVAFVAWAAGRVAPALAARLGEHLGVPFTPEAAYLRIVRATGIPLALWIFLTAPVFLWSLAPPAVLPGTNHLGTTTAVWTAVVLAAAVAGHALRVRAWMSAAVLAVPGIPLLALSPAEPPSASWLPAVAFLGVALTTLLVRAAGLVSGTRIGSRLAPERTVLDAVALLAVSFAVVLSVDVAQPDGLPGLGGTAALVALTAAVVAVLRRVTHHRHWLVIGGALVVGSGGLWGLVADDSAVGWVPLGAACAWTALAVLTAPRLLRASRLGSVNRALAPRTRDDLLLSGWAVAAVAAVPAAIFVLGRVLDLSAAAVSASRTGWLLAPDGVVGPVFDVGTAAAGSALPAWAGLGTAALAVATLAAARLAPGDGAARPERFSAPFLALLAAVGLALHPGLPAVVSLLLLALLGTVLVAATADRHSAWPRLRPVVDAIQETGGALARVAGSLRVIGGRPVTAVEHRLARHASLTGAAAVIVLLGVCSWLSRPTTAAGALAVCALVLALRGTLPRPTHPWLVGIAYVYPLVVLGVVLAWLDLSLVAAVCTVSAAASLVAIAVTLGSRTPRDEWYVVLGVTATPFLAGVVTVVFERTWWSAGAAASMLVLELVLLLTVRRGLPVLVRAGSAFLLLPTASVMTTSAGAMIFEVSGSPYVLPTAATFVAAVAGGAARVAERIDARVPDGGDTLARTLRSTLERSALLTGSITILLAYARPAAGPDIAVAVLLILAAGAALVAREPGRRRVWALAGALLLAALWTALASSGIRLVEAYTFPPALGAVVVGVLVARRLGRSGRRHEPDSLDDDAHPGPPGAGGARNAWALAGAGVALAVVPSFIVYLTRSDAGDWRAWALVGVAFAALGAALLAGRHAWARIARTGLAGIAALTSLAGVIESWRVAPVPGAWPGDRRASSYTTDRIQDPFTGIPAATDAAFVIGLAWAAAAVAVLALSVPVVRPAAGPRLTGLLRRHGFVPALVLGTVSVLAHMEPAWGAVITLFVVELALLALLVLGVRRLAAGRAMGAAPWLVWVCAALVAIAAWSPRELRVETFSAPLGVALILAGWVALRDRIRRDHEAPAIATWPVGFAGSWRTLAPGVLALVGPSVLSTATDPLTVRACGVVFVALMAVLAGSRLRLSAPFWLGIVTLGVEVLVVFAKLGVGVSPLPWILTLVPAALVLLIIATLDERRTAASGGTAAYLRDLR
ncbi:hypothetical protein GCM10027059_03960 [Myceligenerans halotolerans]